jgi:hypothetical protein
MDDVNNGTKDQNVLSFMMQLVQEKYGDDTDIDFLIQESNRLYELFGSNLVRFFEPMLNESQKEQFDKMVKEQTSQESLLAFLIQAIPDLENKIMQVLISFRNQYLAMQQN